MPTYTLGCQRQISAANYIYYADGCPHPDRIMQEHDFVYMINGEWEILQNEVPFTAMNDDVFILHADQHHSGNKNCTPAPAPYTFISPALHRILSSAMHPSPGSTLPPLIHCSSFPASSCLFQELISVRLSPSPNKDRKINALFGFTTPEPRTPAPKIHTHKTPLLTQAITLTAQNPKNFTKQPTWLSSSASAQKTLNQPPGSLRKTFYQYQMEEKIHLVQQFLLDYPDSKLQTVAPQLRLLRRIPLNKIFKNTPEPHPAYTAKPSQQTPSAPINPYTPSVPHYPKG